MDAPREYMSNDADLLDLKKTGFKIHKVVNEISPIPHYIRRDYYKVCIVTGKSIVHYADRSFELDGTYLFFANPHIPYSVDILCDKQNGYGCHFSEDFLRINERSNSLLDSPFFKLGSTPIFKLDEAQKQFLDVVFQKMLDEQAAGYVYKDELIRNSIHLIIHEALKMQPAHNFDKHQNGPARLTAVFMDLLERQFPVESPKAPLKLKAPADYAAYLSVHVNHLNRSVKEITGKPTSAHIAERIISESKALLQHTDWSIGDISYGLGFEYSTYFNNYFKRMTGQTPKSFR
jgi:AraC family transcriptional activator of pobA